jgi:hypothetical protein
VRNRYDTRRGFEARRLQATAAGAYRAGRAAGLGGSGSGNPYPAGSLGAYCWVAGYRGDARSAAELASGWRQSPVACDS